MGGVAAGRRPRWRLQTARDRWSWRLTLHLHHAVVEHSDGRSDRIALTPDRPVADVTGDVLTALTEVAEHVEIDPKPQEVPGRLTRRLPTFITRNARTVEIG
jgi:hypothetical protein